MNLKDLYNKKIVPEMQSRFNYQNAMLVPKIEKVVINRGMGEAVTNSKVVEYTKEQFHLITGQLPVLTKAKNSISNFKIREGQVIGCKVTLRSDMMYDFLTKLINVCIPRIRDFNGFSSKSFDKRGNYSFGIDDDAIFPEVKVDKSDYRQRGMQITIVTSATTDEEARQLLTLFRFPFKK